MPIKRRDFPRTTSVMSNVYFKSGSATGILKRACLMRELILVFKPGPK